MKNVEIKQAINGLLKGKYPSVKIYGKEIREGFETPAFFAEVLDKGSRGQTKNFATGGFTVVITYFQKTTNELDQLQKVDEIKELFGMVFNVGQRKLTVGEFSHDFIGEFSDILQISIDFNYKENTRKEETQEVATEINTNISKS